MPPCRRRRFPHRTAEDVRILEALSPSQARRFDAFLAREKRTADAIARRETPGTEGALSAVGAGVARLVYGTGGGRKRRAA